MDLKTGDVLFEKNADTPFPPASTMKIATVICAIESGRPLDATVIATRELMKKVSRTRRVANGGYGAYTHELTPDATVYGIVHGEEHTLRDLMYGAMLVSGGDACNHIAMMVSGDLDRFVDKMNRLAQGLGCKNTKFYNTHGFYHPKQVTTARDLGKITQYAMKNPVFREIAATPYFERPKSNKQPARKLKNFNSLVVPDSRHYFPGCFGVKTGYHNEAKWNLVAAAKCGDRTLLAVVMQGAERNFIYHDTTALFKAASVEKKVVRKLFSADEAQFKRVISDAKYPIYSKLSRDIAIDYYPSQEPEVNAEIVWRELKMPLKVGDLAGEMRVTAKNGDLLATRPLFLKHTPKPTFWFVFKRFVFPWGLVGVLGLLALFFFYPRKS